MNQVDWSHVQFRSILHFASIDDDDDDDDDDDKVLTRRNNFPSVQHYQPVID